MPACRNRCILHCSPAASVMIKRLIFLKCVCFVFQETASTLRSRMQQQQQEHAVEVQSLILEHESARNSLQQKVQHLQACLA